MRVENLPVPMQNSSAHKKTSTSVLGWLIQGLGIMLLIVFPIGTVIGCILIYVGGKKSRVVKCSECAGDVQTEAKICQHCGVRFSALESGLFSINATTFKLAFVGLLVVIFVGLKNFGGNEKPKEPNPNTAEQQVVDKKQQENERQAAMERSKARMDAIAKVNTERKDAIAKEDAEQRKAEQAKLDQLKDMIDKHQVATGMSADEARASWGSPQTINRSAFSNGNVREQWVYPGGNYLYFVNGKLESISTRR